MLIEFTVENFRSFRDEQRFSFVATNATEHEETHVIQAPTGERLLRAAAVYGANASGKSNLLLALSAMRSVVVNSSRRTQSSRIEEIQPFRLDADSKQKPTTFEAIFVAADGIRYQYGFSATTERVTAEWLYAFPKGRAQLWFSRQDDAYRIRRLAERS